MTVHQTARSRLDLVNCYVMVHRSLLSPSHTIYIYRRGGPTGERVGLFWARASLYNIQCKRLDSARADWSVMVTYSDFRAGCRSNFPFLTCSVLDKREMGMKKKQTNCEKQRENTRRQALQPKDTGEKQNKSNQNLSRIRRKGNFSILN